MQASITVREFVYNGSKLPDPNPSAGIEQVRDILSSSHPELANAAIEGPTIKDGKQVFTFIRSVGTKG
jgi:PRTRC genetic system protein C